MLCTLLMRCELAVMHEMPLSIMCTIRCRLACSAYCFAEKRGFRYASSVQESCVACESPNGFLVETQQNGTKLVDKKDSFGMAIVTRECDWIAFKYLAIRTYRVERFSYPRKLCNLRKVDSGITFNFGRRTVNWREHSRAIFWTICPGVPKEHQWK